jgi:CDGSH-type Zn-finger protein
MSNAEPTTPSIRVAPNGPLVVEGPVAMYRRRMIESEHGEPLTWETTEQLPTSGRTVLCRCGDSGRKPFCDGTHGKNGFRAEDHPASAYDDRARELGGSGITVRDDRSICVHAGFCGTRVTNVWKEVANTAESTVRLAVINMVEKCPSGALTYRLEGETDVEPLLPQAIAVTDDGPLWVTGGVTITTGDGQTLEVRNRVTMCRCGGSANKPLCDGAHKTIGFRESGGS